MVQSQRLQRQKVTLSDGLRLFIFFANENSEGEMSRPIKFTLMDGGMSEVLLSAKCFWFLSSYHLTPLLPDVWRMFLHLNSLCSSKSKNPCVGIEKHLSFPSGCVVHLTKFTDSASSFFFIFYYFPISTFPVTLFIVSECPSGVICENKNFRAGISSVTSVTEALQISHSYV